MFRFHKPIQGTTRIINGFQSQVKSIKLYLDTSSKLIKKDKEERKATLEKEEKNSLAKYKTLYNSLISNGEDHEVASSIANAQSGNDRYRIKDGPFELLKAEIADSYDLLYKSILLIAYSVFEHAFMSICEFVKNYKETKIEMKHLAEEDDHIKKARMYLKIVFDIDIQQKSLRKKAEKLVPYQRIRNRIVHSNSQYSPNDEQVVSHLKTNKYITGGSDAKIAILDSAYVLEFLNLTNIYLSALVPIIEKKLDYPTIVSEIDWYINPGDYHFHRTTEANLDLAKTSFKLSFQFNLKGSTKPLSLLIQNTTRNFRFSVAKKISKTLKSTELDSLSEMKSDYKQIEPRLMKILKKLPGLSLKRGSHLNFSVGPTNK